MSETKTIAVGGSVATLFSTLPDWHVVGLTRDPSKQPKTEGVSFVAADLNTPSTLKAAFANANVIFSTTDFWQHMGSASALTESQSRGVTVNDIAYEREIQQGKNIVDAAASTVATLDRFIMSTLSDARGWSKGAVTFNLHFDAKWKVVEYVKATYPELWAKTSLLQLGLYASNWKIPGGLGVPKKVEGGGYVLGMPMGGEKKFPIVDPVADTGNFTKALLSLPPNTHLVGAGSLISWTDYAAIWAKINNVSVSFAPFPGAVLEQNMGTAGKELADMFRYMDEFGYDGGDPSVVYPWEVKEKFGVDVKYTTIEEYLAKQDWSAYL
ncbi:NAD(P)-binding protein [Byssothecium circinans]|uniref:NAD(P)-binding protein n=1 Tax=Byssothecium circinans TaxID=147558 RepID=A0A6A5UAT8_9PLEO|nr:NAD(P)-binding protein [Byssothecium circinans]